MPPDAKQNVPKSEQLSSGVSNKEGRCVFEPLVPKSAFGPNSLDRLSRGLVLIMLLSAKRSSYELLRTLHITFYPMGISTICLLYTQPQHSLFLALRLITRLKVASTSTSPSQIPAALANGPMILQNSSISSFRTTPWRMIPM